MYKDRFHLSWCQHTTTNVTDDSKLGANIFFFFWHEASKQFLVSFAQHTNEYDYFCWKILQRLSRHIHTHSISGFFCCSQNMLYFICVQLSQCIDTTLQILRHSQDVSFIVNHNIHIEWQNEWQCFVFILLRKEYIFFFVLWRGIIHSNGRLAQMRAFRHNI